MSDEPGQVWYDTTNESDPEAADPVPIKPGDVIDRLVTEFINAQGQPEIHDLSVDEEIRLVIGNVILETTTGTETFDQLAAVNELRKACDGRPAKGGRHTLTLEAVRRLVRWIRLVVLEQAINDEIRHEFATAHVNEDGLLGIEV